ncbi:tripartite tricarboxylate transporter substrate binding protein [Siccirubricoccus sp. KC 17139]|uniref:Tripartite tricarboxylate transporter substrate binding protein n=1 Tax=Siccirubricoccus soli TaxID=2899147 RepID=A0ABT1D8Q5_9PROT|nr:tripartite tricarboxylate transporter substrate binding protein [Siccirubricoccus soli]MCO6417360.1 tripartite tricarboxylate transporter substrate binding protein [Siccirubricoccus soli]MCP2683495.1 tripartite tricarboxylate transporter substrate binding protein [Siccirubricoccus soli]
MRKASLLVACAAAWLGWTQAARAQIQLIIPWPAGGGTDIIGRLIQPVFSEELGGQLVIRNVGGATGTIGTAEVARSKPDGTTLLLTSMAAIAIQPSFRANAPYRAEHLTPICLVAEAPATLMTPKETGIRTIADIQARARAQPGQLPYASGGVGGLGHLAMTGLLRALGVEMNHIPFRGSGDSVMAMQSGTVLMLAAEANLVQQYGLHAIAVFAEKRSPDMPGTPTMREQGHDLVYPLWTGIFAPAGTPDAALARLDTACARTLQTPSVIEGMTRAAHPIRYMDRHAFGAYVRAEVEKYAELIRASGLRQAD